MYEKKKRTYEEILSENRLLHAIVEAVSDGVYAVDKDGTILVYNTAFAKMEGSNKLDRIGKKDYDVYRSPTEKYQRMAVLKSQKPLEEQYMTYYDRDGKKLDIVYNSFPFFDNGELTAVYCIGRDKPSINELTKKLLNIFDFPVAKNRTNGTRYNFEDIIGVSPKIVETINRAKKVAENKSTIMLFGETGTGKELFAQGIHNASSSALRPFIAVNCAAIPENLMESLMMGTVKGAFSGAIDAPGFFEQAEDGTLFLDEINSLSMHLQPKLLRLLQDKTVRRLGDNKERKINCRIICATNQDLFNLANDGRFREDLLYRLTPIVLDIPPLRERPKDILPLARKFIFNFNQLFNLNVERLSQKLLETFCFYDWPGNVRELEHIIESAMSTIGNDETVLTIEHLPAVIRRRIIQSSSKFKKSFSVGKSDNAEKLNDYLLQCEKNFIEQALEDNLGNISLAAKQLGIARQNLHYRLRKLGINNDKYKMEMADES